MPDAFDPYYLWLGIPPEEQPPNHYRLLTIKLFESNPDVVDSAADRQMAHVRSFQSGKHAPESQKLLNELSAARLCLLTPDKKAPYDQALKAKLAHQPVASTRPPAAAATKPLRVAQAVSPARPVAMPATPADPLGFDPLVENAAPRRRKPKRSNQQPVLLAGVGAALLAGVGLIWMLISGGSDQPRQSPEKQTAAAHRTLRSESQNEGHKKASDLRVTPESNNPPSLDRIEPEQAKSADSTGAAGTTTDDDLPSETAADSKRDEMDDADSVDPSESTAADVPPRTAVPDAAALKAAIAEVQSLMKAEFSSAKKPDQKTALAEKLLGLAKDSDTPVERFALLSEAKRLAISAGAAGLAIQAIDALSTEFEVDRFDLAAEAIDEIGGKEQPIAGRKELVEIVSPLVDEAVAAGEFKLARRLATVGLTAARKSNQADVVKTLTRQVRELAEEEKLAESADAARKRLQEKPDDAEAHLVLGKYLCLVLGQWDDGLPHLQQSSDPALRSTAERDLEAPKAAADRVKVGDLWWDLADEHNGSEKERLQARGGYWYAQAGSELTGLNKAKVEKRLAILPGNNPRSTIRRGEQSESPATQSVFLSDLPPEEVKHFPGVEITSRVEFKGEHSPHGIFLHPNDRSPSHVAYTLPKGYRTFEGIAAINDTAKFPVRGGSSTTLTFRIVGDGQPLWTSRPLILNGDSQAFRVSIDRIKKLELFVDCPGPEGMGHAVWIEPRLTGDVVRVVARKTARTKAAERSKWIDLLPLADPKKQKLSATWQRIPDGLRVDKAGTPLTVPMIVDGDFTLHVEFTRQSGNEAIVVLLPIKSKQCMLALSAFNGELSGLETINGEIMPRSEATIRPGTLENGHRYSLDVTVRRDSGQHTIETKLDGKSYVNWSGAITSLSLSNNWTIPRQDVIALAANEPTVFHVAKFKLLSGKATIDADASPASAPTTSLSGAVRTGKGTNDLMRGAVLIATFDEPTVVRENGEVRVRDLSGKQKPGLVVGAEFVPGKSGRALNFRKIGDHVDFGTDPSVNPASFTFCAWVMPAPHDFPWKYVFVKHSGERGLTGLFVRIEGNVPELGIGIGDGQWHYLRPAAPIPLEQWTHVAAAHDAATSSIYINGQLAKSAPSDGAVIASQAPCYIGMTEGHDELQFYGQIDELALFDRALSAAEVQQVYQLGAKGKSLATAGKK